MANHMPTARRRSHARSTAHLQRLELVAHTLLGRLVQDAGIVQDVGGGRALSQQVKLARQRSRGQRRAQQQRSRGRLHRAAAAGRGGVAGGWTCACKATQLALLVLPCMGMPVAETRGSRSPAADRRHARRSRRRLPPLPGGPAPALASAAAPGTPPRRGPAGSGWLCCGPQRPAASPACCSPLVRWWGLQGTWRCASRLASVSMAAWARKTSATLAARRSQAHSPHLTRQLRAIDVARCLPSRREPTTDAAPRGKADAPAMRVLSTACRAASAPDAPGSAVPH